MTTQGDDFRVQELCEPHTDADNGQPSEGAPPDSSLVSTCMLWQEFCRKRFYWELQLDALQSNDQYTLVTRPFQLVLDTLDKLEHNDPKLAFQAARLVGLFRRLWESCVTKHIDAQALENTNQAFRVDNMKLRQEEAHLEKREEDQATRLAYFQESMDHAREQISDALGKWNMYVLDDANIASQGTSANKWFADMNLWASHYFIALTIGFEPNYFLKVI